MYLRPIEPVTLGSATAAFHARLLYAGRFLQVPEGRAFLLFQVRGRQLLLTPGQCRQLLRENTSQAHTCQSFSCLLLRPTELPPISTATAVQGKSPVDGERLDITWPSEMPPPDRILDIIVAPAPQELALSTSLIDLFT